MEKLGLELRTESCLANFSKRSHPFFFEGRLMEMDSNEDVT